jgi:FG-GAP repeat
MFAGSGRIDLVPPGVAKALGKAKRSRLLASLQSLYGGDHVRAYSAVVREKKVGSRAWMVLAAVLLAQAQPASTLVLRSFDRVLLLEPRAETSAGVSVGDVNRDGLPDIVLGKGAALAALQSRAFERWPWRLHRE